MKTFIRQSIYTNTGYELVTIDENGEEFTTSIDKTYPGEPMTLVLPENDSGRKYFNIKKVENAGGCIELTRKESRPTGPRSEFTTRKGLEEYLDGEDKELYLKLVEKAKANREKANKKQPMTELEKARRAVERAQAKLDELEKRGV